MPEPNENEPRIFIDDDWKEQARREKEEADRMTRQDELPGELPAPSLAEIVQMIAVQATFGLGGIRDPQTGQVIPPDLMLARHYIDLLELFQQKTADRVNDNEKAIIEGTLHELRMLFVHVAQAGAAPANEPKAKPQQAGERP
jgi:hypothetical protein